MSATVSGVIIVDDREEDTYLLSRLLQRAGLDVPPLTFSSGEAAREFLSAAAEDGVLPALAFIDVTLVGLSGFELLEWLRADQRLKAMVVVLLSASDEPRNLGKAAQLEADCFAVKFPPLPALRDLLAAAASTATLGHPRPLLPVACNLLTASG